MSTDDESSVPDAVRLQQLAGGARWHCPAVGCTYVDSADHDLSGPTKTVRWNADERVLEVMGEPTESLMLADVCNHCRHANGWRRPPWFATDD